MFEVMRIMKHGAEDKGRTSDYSGLFAKWISIRQAPSAHEDADSTGVGKGTFYSA